MATTSMGYTDSKTTKLSLSVPTLSYSTDFAVKSETANEVILTNTTSPIDQPETVRFGIQNISNVYSGTPIALESQSVTKRGIQVLVQLNDIMRVTPSESECQCLPFDLPISSHHVIRVALNPNVTPDLIQTVILRNIALFYDGAVNSNRIGQLVRGALKPQSM